MKAVATFSFTAAEELRDVAEKEAATAADREAALQDQLNVTKVDRVPKSPIWFPDVSVAKFCL